MMQMKKEDYEVPLMPSLNSGQHMGPMGVSGPHGGPQASAHDPHLAHTGHTGLGLDHMALLGMAHPHAHMGGPHQMAGGGAMGVGGNNMDAKSSTRSISPPMIPCGLTDTEL